MDQPEIGLAAVWFRILILVANVRQFYLLSKDTYNVDICMLMVFMKKYIHYA